MRFLDTNASSPSPASSLSKDSADFFLSTTFFSFLTPALCAGAEAGVGATPSLASSSESVRFLRSWPLRLVAFGMPPEPAPTAMPGPFSSSSSIVSRTACVKEILTLNSCHEGMHELTQAVVQSHVIFIFRTKVD